MTTPLLFLDLETTGLWPYTGHRVIQLCARRVVGGKREAELLTYINPERPIEPEISGVHMIFDHHVRDAPVFGDIAGQLADLAAGAIIVAHNAWFDVSFVEMELNILRYTTGEIVRLQAPWLDSQEIAQKYFSYKLRAFNLSDVAAGFGYEVGSVHRADVDVDMMEYAFDQMLALLQQSWPQASPELLLDRQEQAITVRELEFPELSEYAGLFEGEDMSLVYKDWNAPPRPVRGLYPGRNGDNVYLICHQSDIGQNRTFRLDRVISLKPRLIK